MTQATIRTAVYNAVNGVSNVGKVYDYERWSSDWLVFLGQFKTNIGGTEQIRGWTVSFAGYAPAPEIEAVNPPGSGQNIIARSHVFKAMGYMGLNDTDATEKTFAALAEAVADALDTDSTLRGGTYFHCSPANIEFFGTLMLGGVLCNHAEITIVVTEALEK